MQQEMWLAPGFGLLWLVFQVLAFPKIPVQLAHFLASGAQVQPFQGQFQSLRSERHPGVTVVDFEVQALAKESLDEVEYFLLRESMVINKQEILKCLVEMAEIRS